MPAHSLAAPRGVRVPISIENSQGHAHHRSRHFENGLDTVSMPNERTCREALSPRRMARPGPSKAIRKPSPAVFTSRPGNRANSLRTMTWCCCSSSPHFRSPISAACFVESTISVKRTVAKSRCLGGHTKATRSKRLSSTLPSLKYPVSMITDDLFSGLV
jgi:hypothetical protein